MPQTVYNINFGSGKLEPIEVESKNNLPRGTVLRLYGYNNPYFVIAEKIGHDDRWGHGDNYRTIDLDTLIESRHDALTLSWPSEGQRGIHTEITDKVLSEDEVRDIEARAVVAKAEREEAERQAAAKRAQDRADLERSFPYLIKLKESKQNPWSLGAKNLRTELSRNFPGIKFSVRSESYSGGDSIHVSWTDGPTSEKVKDISDKYQKNDFNGMEDISESRHALWPTIYGGANYVFEERHHEDETYVTLTKALCNLYGYEYTEPWYSVRLGDDRDDVRTLIHKILGLYAIPAGHKVTGLERTEVACGPIETFYRITTEGPAVPPEPEKPTGTDRPTGATVTRNEKMNGLEIRFPSKPAGSILSSLKAQGWRWSKFSGCWYVRYTEEQETFARGLVTEDEPTEPEEIVKGVNDKHSDGRAVADAIEAGTFQDSSLINTTGVASRLVIVDKED